MKKFLILILCLNGLLTTIYSQTGFNDSLAGARIRITKNAMYVLGGWAVANIGSGFVLAANSSGETKYFWLMNSYWNFINLGIAGIALAGIHKAENRTWSLADNYAAQLSIEKLYVFNIGLDLAYMGGGLYLHERSKTAGSVESMDKFAGYGKSIFFQGAFLLVMDVIVYMLHHRNTKLLDSRLRKMKLGYSPGALSLRISF
jgi:hypothetical protein